jgi:hypothetical protein
MDSLFLAFFHVNEMIATKYEALPNQPSVETLALHANYCLNISTGTNNVVFLQSSCDTKVFITLIPDLPNLQC